MLTGGHKLVLFKERMCKGMEITKISVTPYENGRTKGFATITIDDAFVVTGITIVEGQNGKFISFPQKKNKDDEWKDICFPNSKEVRESLTSMILDAYNEKLNEDEKPASKKVVKK